MTRPLTATVTFGGLFVLIAAGAFQLVAGLIAALRFELETRPAAAAMVHICFTLYLPRFLHSCRTDRLLLTYEVTMKG